MATGRFITLEGGEGAGKSTQIRLLAQGLTDRGVEVVTTREPGGGSDGAAAIRGLLVAGDTPWQRLTEALLHNAARHENVEALVRPALARGAWVLCDRYVDSTVAYQGYAMGVDRGILSELHRLSTGNLMPDLTLVLDLPVEAGLARAGARPGTEDRYERMGMDFHERLRQGFLDIAAHDAGRCAVIDATGDIATIQARLLGVVERRLGPLGRAA
ncbi:Thymidylate kinase [Nitrospirillum viridazoti Y2]|uniref:Thymidylate kinase n=1 Tax=Nitrospirillum amazonense TaxID=28077 RepID=A0A560HJA6_9PROT|nr:dTMP kinase [Nitrospirillum amazonense]EGY00605.1 Thymidylate kinase [Nitrospirillum amazonense Y2]TWB46563.1 thymidylate kinase [Nitrospirillum amazonense]